MAHHGLSLHPGSVSRLTVVLLPKHNFLMDDYFEKCYACIQWKMTRSLTH